jgi:hypothetical protein
MGYTGKNRKRLKRIIQNYWPKFLDRYFDLVPDYVTTVFSKTLLCGTEALGCHIYKCLKCGFTTLVKHSCKVRFCSICMTAYIDKWAAKIKYWLGMFSASYYFITFTIPKELESIVKVNKRLLYNAMFKSASYAIQSFWKEKKVTGGIIALLHIVGRLLNYHPHIHLLASYGGLLFNKSAWKDVFLPVPVLQSRFKKHFLDMLRDYYKQGKLVFPEDMHFKNFAKFDAFLKKMGRKHWQINRRGPIKAADAAVEYIGRYLGKPPISEGRIQWYSYKEVCFTFKDYLNKAITRKKIMPINELFWKLIHAVPLPRFPMVRFYGFFSTRSKSKFLPLLKELKPIEGLPPLEPPKTCREHRIAKTGKDPLKCPKCDQNLELVKVYFPGSLDIPFAELLENWSKDEVDTS